MKKKKQALDDKNYISGIYNYCDRWCEKCAYTANCLLFTNESKIITHEILNNGDLTGLKDVLYDDFTDDEGEDYSDDFLPDDEEIFGGENKWDIDKEEEEKPPHMLEILSDEFFEKGHSFLNSINEKYNLFPPQKEKLLDPRFKRIHDGFEVISWYHTFIGAKVRRALMGKEDLFEEEDEEMRGFTHEDINGSAKVAAIGITRSIVSLNQLYSELTEHHTEISELLVIAGKMLNEVELEFPGYKEFKRPGFDE
ncbi:MAG: hypothetical protein R6W90_07845 [Ignavibacteriaceae bacterium]